MLTSVLDGALVALCLALAVMDARTLFIIWYNGIGNELPTLTVVVLVLRVLAFAFAALALLCQVSGGGRERMCSMSSLARGSLAM